MADKNYFTLVTDAGNAAIINAVASGTRVNITTFGVGDGGGAYNTPTPGMTALAGQKWSGAVNGYAIDPDSSNIIIITAVVPASVGGFTMREMGVFTDDGTLFAVGNMPDTEKVTLASGAEGEVEITMRIIVANTNDVTFVIDPNVVTATKKDIADHNADPDAHAELFAGISGNSIVLSGEAPPQGVKLHLLVTGEALNYISRDPEQTTPTDPEGDLDVLLQDDDGNLLPDPTLMADNGETNNPGLQI